MNRVQTFGFFVAFCAAAAVADYVTPAAGGGGGTPFTIACPADKVLIGIRGDASTTVNRVDGICVRLNGNGTWTEKPTYDGGRAGGGGGMPYEVRCPANSAVSVIAGRAGQAVDQLQIGCNPLTSNGNLTGGWTMQAAVGGTGGTAFGPKGFNCTDWRPGRGFSGRASSTGIDQIALACEYPQVPPPPPPPPPPAGPTLVSPADDADLFHLYDSYRWVTLDWEPVNGATKYQVCLGGGDQLGCANGPNTRFFDNLTATELTLSDAILRVPAGAPAGTLPLYGRWLKWGVKACNNDGCGTSAVRDLWIRFPPAQLVAPAADITLNTYRPTFQWTAVPGAEGYRINISTPTDNWSSFQHFDVAGGTTTQYTPTTDVERGGGYWSVITCKPVTSCGFSGRVADNPPTQRWFTIRVDSGNALTWTTPISAANAPAGMTVGAHLLGKTLSDIINSRPIPNTNPQQYTSGRLDGKRCSECHAQQNGLAAYYRPFTGEITPATWAYSGRNANTNPTSPPYPNSYKWSYVVQPASSQQTPTAATVTQASIVENFCYWVGRTPANKPQDLCNLFRKWLADGGQ